MEANSDWTGWVLVGLLAGVDFNFDEVGASFSSCSLGDPFSFLSGSRTSSTLVLVETAVALSETDALDGLLSLREMVSFLSIWVAEIVFDLDCGF